MELGTAGVPRQVILQPFTFVAPLVYFECKEAYRL